MTDFKALLRILSDASVEFIVVGGVAAAVHGSARATFDLDVVYRRTPENIDRLALALLPYHPYLRGAPPGLPFRWDAATIQRGMLKCLTLSPQVSHPLISLAKFAEWRPVGKSQPPAAPTCSPTCRSYLGARPTVRATLVSLALAWSNRVREICVDQYCTVLHG